ncbi:hypothetical protein M6D93_01360 [Jatrophihabitans telluris]|uniref:PH domain-containing protein n=1 Tax=Jatrophihabitans telluris TaxID=2038343 RepID=A0ABY4QZZ1_9ACTN|nr:hypothetical protein [Jatrophihabitans telluris]UQX88662.1 hypothetical protein M6D93_01360 [Jatrophihabitans telluris]
MRKSDPDVAPVAPVASDPASVLKFGRGRRWLGVAYLAMAVCYVAAHWSNPAEATTFGAAWTIFAGAAALMPSTRIDAAGVHQVELRWDRGPRFRRTVAWHDVSEIVRPPKGSLTPAVHVRTVDGELVRLMAVPVDRVSEIAAISGKPTVTGPPESASPLPAPAPVPARPSEHEEQRRLDVRFAALQARQRQLEEGIRRRPAG